MQHIFEYVTVKDIRELTKYAETRIQRQDATKWQTLLSIVHVGSYHPERGSNKAVQELHNKLGVHGRDYLVAKLDKKGLSMLAQQVNGNRATAE